LTAQPGKKEKHMARIRTFKADLFTDSKTGSLSGPAFKLFLGLLSHADDNGVLRLNLEELRMKILPYEKPVKADGKRAEFNVVARPLLDELFAKGLIWFFGYSADDESEPTIYLHIVHFHRHQRISHPGEPLIAGWQTGDTPETFGERTGAARFEASVLPPPPAKSLKRETNEQAVDALNDEEGERHSESFQNKPERS
jgi:hypothetical protein